MKNLLTVSLLSLAYGTYAISSVTYDCRISTGASLGSDTAHINSNDDFALTLPKDHGQKEEVKFKFVEKDLSVEVSLLSRVQGSDLVKLQANPDNGTYAHDSDTIYSQKEFVHSQVTFGDRNFSHYSVSLSCQRTR